MKNEEQASYLARMVSSVPGFEQFLISYDGEKNMYKIVSAFQDKLKSEGRLTEEYNLSLKILLEKYEDIKDNTYYGLHHINKHLQIDDSAELQDFFEEKRKLTQKEWIFKRAEIQHYKTIREKIAYQKVDYSSVIEKYIKSSHPYICSQIALAYINAKKYHIGLPFLQKALFHVFSSPNIYWHNVFGIIGCTDALFELQHLLGRIDMDKLTPLKSNRILSCLYLYLSRAISLCDSDMEIVAEDSVPYSAIMKINYLSMRGDLEYDYKYDFHIIFGFGVNPDIQFISDKYLSHHEAQKYGLQMITEQNYKDSQKMYRHGSLIPNDTGGYYDIEDATWGELVQRGQIRAEEIAVELYDRYKRGEFRLSIDELSQIMTSLRNRLYYIPFSDMEPPLLLQQHNMKT